MSTPVENDPPLADIAAFERGLRLARRLLGSDVSALRLMVLINVYLHEGLSQRELAQVAGGISAPALSRNLADLSNWSSRKTTGLNMIELRSDPMNLRVKRIYLTNHGRRFIDSLMNELAQP